MNNIFRFLISIIIFVLVFCIISISNNILAILITGESNPLEAHLKLSETNMLLQTTLLILLIIIPIYSALKFYRSNLLRKK